MKKCFVIGLIMALVPQVGAIAAQATVDMLIAEKQAKIKKLEKCKGTTKDLKIAGISTLGITAVGVGANIAEAVVLDDYKGKVKTEKAELAKAQQYNKKLQDQANQATPEKPYNPSNDSVESCEDAKKLLISKNLVSANDSCVCAANGITCGNSSFEFKEIKEAFVKIEEAPVSEISTTEIKVKTCGEAKALLLKHKMIDAKATCECDIEDAITCGTKTFFFDKIENAKDTKVPQSDKPKEQENKKKNDSTEYVTKEYSCSVKMKAENQAIVNGIAECRNRRGLPDSGKIEHIKGNQWKETLDSTKTIRIWTLNGLYCDDPGYNIVKGLCSKMSANAIAKEKELEEASKQLDAQLNALEAQIAENDKQNKDPKSICQNNAKGTYTVYNNRLKNENKYLSYCDGITQDKCTTIKNAYTGAGRFEWKEEIFFNGGYTQNSYGSYDPNKDIKETKCWFYN